MDRKKIMFLLSWTSLIRVCSATCLEIFVKNMNKYKKTDAYQPIKFKQNQELVPWENTNFLACIFKLGHILKI